MKATCPQCGYKEVRLLHRKERVITYKGRELVSSQEEGLECGNCLSIFLTPKQLEVLTYGIS